MTISKFRVLWQKIRASVNIAAYTAIASGAARQGAVSKVDKEVNEKMAKRQMKIGDYITFTVTTRDGRRKARRKVLDFDRHGRPEVRYEGWSRFVVGCFPTDKIHKVERA